MHCMDIYTNFILLICDLKRFLSVFMPIIGFSISYMISSQRQSFDMIKSSMIEYVR